uniref:Abnormal spindle-like microcephaly-associated protein ASH domain-containing protein n=1 Tax=Ciona savignyi TaxID=51511 RepID=H2Z575_CIOSA
MAAVKSRQIAGLKSSKQTSMLDEFISPVKRINVPNHILDTKIFNKLSQNSVTKVQPDVVHFAGYKLNKTQKTSIKICNASPQRQNLHIIPPATKYFSIHYTKPDRLVPGFTIEVVISFTPDEWRYYYDCIRIHCKGEENLIVPLHAFPVMDTSRFPRKLVFPQSGIRIGESSRKILPLYSHSPVEFEFQITVLQSHPSIVVSPLSGIVPGEGETDIAVTFTPMEYVTAHMTMQLVISQFNTKPFLCDVTASCSPSAALKLTKSVKDLDEMYRQTKLLDPRCLS